MAAAPSNQGPLATGATPQGAGLRALRIVFGTFVYALAMIAGVAVFLANGSDAPDGALDATTASLLAAGVAVACLGAVRVVEPDLRCETPQALAGSYRARYFLRLALAEAGPLVGFALVVVTGSAWPYLAALVPAALGFLRAAPTGANLERDQQELDLRGCPHRLVPSLDG